MSDNIPYRRSRFINFETGEVFLDPETFVDQQTHPMDVERKIDFFECRVDVWQLGVAAAMLKQMEHAEKSSVWAQADHALIAVTTSFFEMTGKILNLNSTAYKSSSEDFDAGFADVFPDFERKHGKIGVERFRKLMRNGMYHLAYPKKNLLVHHSPKIWQEVKLEDVYEKRGEETYGAVVSLVNPRRVTQTMVNHFGWFMDRLRGRPVLRENFERFFDEFHEPDV